VDLAGAVRAQLHLRQILTSLEMPIVTTPEVMIGNAAGRFDDEGVLVDEVARQRIRQLLEGLMDLSRLHARARISQPAA
jgi:chromate reductase